MKPIRKLLISTILLLLYCGGVIIYLYPWTGLAIGVVVLAGIGRRGVQYTAHGNARFAEAIDIPHLLEGTGLILGYIAGRPSKLKAMVSLFDKKQSHVKAVQGYVQASQRKHSPHLVRLTTSVHTSVFAPTGVGKGVSCVIPFLLTCRDSCVVVDFKGELAEKTARYRRDKLGHRIVLLNPYGVMADLGQPLYEFQQDTFNPLDFIDPNSDFAIDDCADLANALVVRKGTEHEPQWNDNAEKWIKIISAFLVSSGESVSLQNVKDIVANPQFIELAIKKMSASPAWDGLLSRMGNELKHFKDRELGSVLTTTNRHLQFLDTLAISANTRESSFDPADLLNKKMTVYLILPPDRMKAQAGVLRMWLGSMFRAVIRGGAQEKRLVHYIIDEASSVGRMDAINVAIDTGRGYGQRLQFYWQSQGQLKTVFPEDEGQTLLSNCSAVYFGVNDQQTATYVSQRLGQATVLVESYGSNVGGSQSSDNKGGGSSSTSWGNSKNWSQQGKPLLRPEQVERLDPRIAITFAPGAPPILTRLCRYYEGGFTDPPALKRWKLIAETAALFLCVAFFAYCCTGLLMRELEFAEMWTLSQQME